ncbi:MAG TPA: cytochrome P450 [Microlunatus sp.]|nr:cytochrome P450 [Microlunatus sp.]
MAVREQIRFLTAFAKERAVLRYGAHLRRDPLSRLHLNEGRRNPYPIYDEVRARGRLIRSTAGVWTTASHDVCEQVLRDRRFGVEMRAEDQRSGSPQLSFLEMDPPDHTRLRRFVMPTFSPRAVAGFDPRITEIIGGLLDAVPGDGGFDLVADFAAPMPIAVITRLLGIPDASSAEFERYGATFGSALGGLQSLRHARELFEAQKQLQRIFTELMEVRRAEPADDVISRLVTAPGEQITPDDMVPMCTLLLIAGFETTVNLIGNTVHALLQRPHLWRRLVDDPRLVDAAVEETLRFDPPVQRTARVAHADVEVAGRRVAAGELVITLIGGAGRDPQVVDRPDEFDLDRDRRDHLAFSAGLHYCVGAPLAKLEASIAVRELVTRFPDLVIDGRAERRGGTLIRGLASLPVRTALAARRSYATA